MIPPPPRLRKGSNGMLSLRTAGFLAAAGLFAMTAEQAAARGADPLEFTFDGTARIGGDTRPVRLRLFCSSNDGPHVTGALSVVLEVPGYEQLHDVFDFDPFEGPDANAGALTLLRTSGVRSKAGARFPASGFVVPSGSSEAFALEVTASRREAGPLRKLAAVLRPLLDGPGHLEWRQDNTWASGVPLVAGVDLTKAQGDQVKAGLGPCLDAR